MKRLVMLAVAGALMFGFGLVGTPLAARLYFGPTQVADAQWESMARSVAEQAAEADAIVRVRVEKVDATRSVRVPLEVKDQREGLKVDAVPFTDSRMRVLEVYKGSVGKQVFVLQTGGRLPASADHPLIDVATEGDPLYVEGGEHILFLKNIAGDQVHGQGRQIYRIVNPAGRYDVRGDGIEMHWEIEQAGLPTTLTALQDQIKQALAR